MPIKVDKDGLNSQQRLFVNAKLEGKNTTNAAIAAGYSAKTAASAGSRLLKHVKVQQVLGRGVAAAVERAELSVDYVLNRLLAIESGEATPASAAIRALELLGKHMGMFPDRMPMQNPADAETDELTRKRNEIRKRHGLA